MEAVPCFQRWSTYEPQCGKVALLPKSKGKVFIYFLRGHACPPFLSFRPSTANMKMRNGHYNLAFYKYKHRYSVSLDNVLVLARFWFICLICFMPVMARKSVDPKANKNKEIPEAIAIDDQHTFLPLELHAGLDHESKEDSIDEDGHFAAALAMKHSHNPHNHNIFITPSPNTMVPTSSPTTNAPQTLMPTKEFGSFSPTRSPFTTCPTTRVPVTCQPTRTPTDSWLTAAPFTKAPSTTTTEALDFTCIFESLPFYQVAEDLEKLEAFSLNIRFALSTYTSLPLDMIEVFDMSEGSTIVNVRVSMQKKDAPQDLDIVTPHNLAIKLLSNPAEKWMIFMKDICEVLMWYQWIRGWRVRSSKNLFHLNSDKVSDYLVVPHICSQKCQIDTSANVTAVLQRHFEEILQDSKVTLIVKPAECSSTSFVFENLDSYEGQKILQEFLDVNLMFEGEEEWTKNDVRLGSINLDAPVEEPRNEDRGDDSIDSKATLASMIVFVCVSVVTLGVGLYCYAMRRKADKELIKIKSGSQIEPLSLAGIPQDGMRRLSSSVASDLGRRRSVSSLYEEESKRSAFTTDSVRGPNPPAVLVQEGKERGKKRDVINGETSCSEKDNERPPEVGEKKKSISILAANPSKKDSNSKDAALPLSKSTSNTAGMVSPIASNVTAQPPIIIDVSANHDRVKEQFITLESKSGSSGVQNSGQNDTSISQHGLVLSRVSSIPVSSLQIPEEEREDNQETLESDRELTATTQENT
eukprot:jgi/Bigna1/77235/fgenesh1_pg.46_\